MGSRANGKVIFLFPQNSDDTLSESSNSEGRDQFAVHDFGRTAYRNQRSRSPVAIEKGIPTSSELDLDDRWNLLDSSDWMDTTR